MATLLSMVQEVENHGFSDAVYGARIRTFINQAYLRVARRVNWYAGETSETVATVQGTNLIPLPANLARVRTLVDTDRDVTLSQVMLDDIDNQTPTNGTPLYWAVDNTNLHLFPTPDGVHNLLLRYWLLPSQLVNDTDAPLIPDDYCDLLEYHAIARCYASEDDSQTAQYWDGQYNARLAEFEADAKFPVDESFQAGGMWQDAHAPLAGSRVWGGWGFW